MADENEPTNEPDKGKADEFTPITSQADLDRVLGARLARERERTAEKLAEVETLREKAAEYDKAVEAAQTEQEKAVKAAREEGKTEALTTANTRLVNAEARALAAEAKFRNPSLAVRGIELKDVKVNDDGTVDQDAIKSKLKALSDADPYLVDDGKPGKPKPDRSQGGGGAADTASVSRGKEMYAERRGTKTA